MPRPAADSCRPALRPGAARLVIALAVVLLAGPGLLATGPAAAAGSAGWTAAWGVPMAWGYGTATNATVRQLARLSAGGDLIRVRLSNAFGNAPLTVGAASVGVSAGGAGLQAGSVQMLTFGGSVSATVAVGAVAYSDPVPMVVSAGETLAVSVYVPGAALASVHPCCAPKVSSYYTANGAGDHVDDLAGRAFRANSWSEWVDAVDVMGTAAPGVVVAFGDSITDGFRSAALDWPEALQERLSALPAADQWSVLDEAITANTLTTTTVSDALKGGGPPGLARLERDVLSQPGLQAIILAEGTNDLWFGATAGQVIAGMEQVVAVAHQQGIRVIGTTILPRAGSLQWTQAMEANRQEVNDWIRTGGAFDGVIDFARVIEDAYGGACDPAAFYPPFDSGDHLHPNPAGETAMANAIDGSLLGLPAVPALPVRVAVTSTVTPAGAVTPTVVTRTVSVGPEDRTPGCDPGPLFLPGLAVPPLLTSPTPLESPSPIESPSPNQSPAALAPGRGGGLSHRDRMLLLGGGAAVGLLAVLGFGVAPLERSRRRRARSRRPPGSSRPRW
jgi:lysophospholipase L1-like esterase